MHNTVVASMEVRPTLQLTTTKLKTYIRPYAHHCCRRPTS